MFVLVFLYNYHFLRFVPFIFPSFPFSAKSISIVSLSLSLLSDGHHTSRLMSILILDAKHPIHSLLNSYLCANRTPLCLLCVFQATPP